MDGLIAEFLTETNESLDELDLDLVNLEKNPNDKLLLGKIFRLMHTIKGTCSFLNLPRLEKTAHHAENVLARFRAGELDVTEKYVTLIFEAVDRIKFIIGTLNATGKEPEGDDLDLIARLDAAYASAPFLAAVPEVETTMGDGALHGLRVDGVVPQSVRVNVGVLENLVTMVSELALTHSQLLHILRTNSGSDFTKPLLRLGCVVSDLQEGIMKIRMQPIGHAWQTLPRIIRDLSRELGKQIDLEMRGQDTDLDRLVLEMIKAPLIHMVRNCAAHGIETPAERVADGKNETGTIVLEAFHDGGHVIIKLSDDGKGLALETIKNKAISSQLASAEDLERMSAQQIQQFIFTPGFSTAETITSLSGRGVGMDVVRTNIETIGGAIEMHSVEGEGTTFTIRIPLTLAQDRRDEDFQSAVDVSNTIGRRRVLLVDGSAFFRTLLAPLLNRAGYHVTTVESAAQALKLCDEGVLFDTIISDIEMPDMDGFEFAQRVRDNSLWQAVPMVALSTHATPQDIDRGRKVGFSHYVAKFDRDALLNSLLETVETIRTAEQASNTSVQE